MKLAPSIQPDDEALYKVPSGPPCFQVSYRCLALYTTYGGKRVPDADPQAIVN